MIEELFDPGDTVYVRPDLSLVVFDPLKEREAGPEPGHVIPHQPVLGVEQDVVVCQEQRGLMIDIKMKYFSKTSCHSPSPYELHIYPSVTCKASECSPLPSSNRL